MNKGLLEIATQVLAPAAAEYLCLKTMRACKLNGCPAVRLSPTKAPQLCSLTTQQSKYFSSSSVYYRLSAVCVQPAKNAVSRWGSVVGQATTVWQKKNSNRLVVFRFIEGRLSNGTHFGALRRAHLMMPSGCLHTWPLDFAVADGLLSGLATAIKPLIVLPRFRFFLLPGLGER